MTRILLSTVVAVVAVVAAVQVTRGFVAGSAARTENRPPAVPAGQAPAFDSSRAWAHLNDLVALGPRPAGSPGIRQTRAYITRQLSELGLTVLEQPFVADTPRGQVEMINLIVRLDGQREDKILLTGHYDTKPFREFTFVGANDGGSSGAFLIELARVLKDRPREYTWELVWFDGEEAFCLNWTDCGTTESPDNTYGSRFYVQTAQTANALARIKAMILVDMIAERGAQFLRETRSTTWLKDIIWSTADQMGHASTFPSFETPIEDDHYPFLDAGVDAVDIIDLNYVHWHEATDTIDKLSSRSLQAVGDVLLAALPKIERHLIDVERR